VHATFVNTGKEDLLSDICCAQDDASKARKKELAQKCNAANDLSEAGAKMQTLAMKRTSVETLDPDDDKKVKVGPSRKRPRRRKRQARFLLMMMYRTAFENLCERKSNRCYPVS
jgi:hypothetical protein